MLQKIFAATVLLAYLTNVALAQPLPSGASNSAASPASPKSPKSFHRGMSSQFLSNAGQSGIEAVKAAGGLTVGGAMGGVGSAMSAVDHYRHGYYGSGTKKLVGAVARPAAGVALGGAIGTVHVAHAGLQVACAAGHACASAMSAVTRENHSHQHTAQHHANGVRLGNFKKESNEHYSKLTEGRSKAIHALAGVPTKKN